MSAYGTKSADNLIMSVNLSVSIILCTCNRAAPLQKALGTLGKVSIRPDWEAELLVVDNGSADDTATVVRNAKLGNMEVRYLREAQKGKGHALNAGLAKARGDIILFTDDDVILAEDWAEQIMSPLLHGSCDAVTGQITLAPNLMRPWMTPAHRWWLASSHDALPYHGSREMIGANMGFRRSVLERVGAFDPELGPGALGVGDDTLFGWQLAEAGFRIGHAPKAGATHQLDASRLRRINWLSEARKHGRSEAYLRNHWEHSDIQNPRLRQFCYFIKLQLRRVLQRPPPLESEGCPLWEMSYVLHMEMCKQFCFERRRPRNYSRRGLTKRILPGHSANGVIGIRLAERARRASR
jgi:glycosyltransferase involved in cell wall biosynthesis